MACANAPSIGLDLDGSDFLDCPEARQRLAAERAYLNKVNEEGGINGRKIKFISYDDGYSPPKTVEQARKLVERDHVLLIFSSLGTATNTAIHKYMNTRKVPQLFVATNAAKWDDPKNYPWTMGFGASYQGEGHLYAKYLLEHYPNGKIGILYQNDDYGKDYVKGLKDGLAGRMQIVAELPYETSDTTIDSQIVILKASGADVFYDVTAPKFASQAIRKAAELNWKPVHILNSVSGIISSVLKPAGLDNSKGILSATAGKDQTEGRSRIQGMGCFHGQLLSGRRSGTWVYGRRISRRADAGKCADSMWRRSHP